MMTAGLEDDVADELPESRRWSGGKMEGSGLRREKERIGKTDCQTDGLSGSSADDPGQEGRWRAKRETGSVWGEDEGSHIKVGGEAGTGGGRSTRGLIPRGRVVVVAVSVVRDQSWARFRECCALARAERSGPWRGMLGRDGASGGERERERLRPQASDLRC